MHLSSSCNFLCSSKRPECGLLHYWKESTKLPKAKSPSTGANQRIHTTKGGLDRLPNDLLVYLFLSPELDFATLYAIGRTSRRMQAVVHCVFQNYLLPNMHLMMTIDQEGRGRWTSYYNFAHIDPHTLSATFLPLKHTHKRYRCDGATEAPVIRQLAVLHQPPPLTASFNAFASTSNFSLLKEARMLESSPLSSSMVSLNVGLDSKDTIVQDVQEKPSTQDTDAPQASFYIFKNASRRIRIAKCGIQRVHAWPLSQRLVSNAVNNYTASRQAKVQPWRLCYYVDSQKHVVETIHNITHSQITRQYPNTDDESPILPIASLRDSEPGFDNVKSRYIIPLYLTVHVSVLGMSTQEKPLEHSWISWMRQKCRLAKSK